MARKSRRSRLSSFLLQTGLGRERGGQTPEGHCSRDRGADNPSHRTSRLLGAENPEFGVKTQPFGEKTQPRWGEPKRDNPSVIRDGERGGSFFLFLFFLPSSERPRGHVPLSC